MKSFKAGGLLKKSFVRLKKHNPGVSIRGLAGRLNLSHVFLSKVLSGKAALPPARIKQVAKVFQLDPFGEKELKDAVIADLDASRKIEKVTHTSGRRKRKKAIDQYEERSIKHQTVLEHWYELPILDYLTCEKIPKDVNSIARHLGLKQTDVLRSLEKMAASHLIERDESGQWKKVTAFIRFPATVPSATLKNYYTQVLRRALQELNKTSQKDYDRRLLINFSIATSAAKIPEFKQRLSQLVYDLSIEMADGDADEVYHLTLGLIPLLAPGDKGRGS
jgi:uncharacterized protein (TIGR02147 family)